MSETVRGPRSACRRIQGLFPSFLQGDLDAEQRGRVKGHLSTCERCSRALFVSIEDALARGEILSPEIPPTPSLIEEDVGPAVAAKAGPLSEQTEPAVRGRGDSSAWSWDRLLEAAMQELGAASNAAKEQLRELERLITDTLPWWRAAPKFAGELTLGSKAHIPLNLESGATQLEAPGPSILARVEAGPVLTVRGEFFFQVSWDSQLPKGINSIVACVGLVEGQAVEFSADIQPLGAGPGWQAEFRVGGLPSPVEEVGIPLERIQLFGVP